MSRYLKLILCLLILPLFSAVSYAENEILYVFGKEGAGHFENDYLRETDPAFQWIGIDVTENNEAEYLAMQMLTKNDCFDIYAVGYAYCGLTRLNERGFCLDLSSISELTNIAENYRPFIQNAIWSDDILFTIPFDISISGWGYNQSIAENMHLSNSMPTTYSELFHLFSWWLDEGCDLYPEYELLVGPSNFKRALCSSMILEYVNYCTLMNQRMDFNNEPIKSLLHQLETLDTDELDRREEMAAEGIAYSKPSLLIMDCNYSDLSGNDGMDLLPLKIGITEDDNSFIADVYCFSINPFTTRVDMAATYISSYLQNLDPITKFALFDNNQLEPIEDPDYEMNMKENSELHQIILTSSEIDDSERKELLAKNELEREQLIENRWYVSQNQIDHYSNIISRTLVRKQNILERNSSNGTLEIQKYIDQYATGDISLDTFILKANQVLQLILAEDN